MDKGLMAFVVVLVILIADVVLMALGTLATEVGLPILTLVIGAAVGYLFPSPLS